MVKSCKHFCEKVFIPEKERVEIELSKKTKIQYTPIKMLNRTNKAFSKTLKNLYMM